MSALIEDIQAVLNPLAAGGSWYAENTSQQVPPLVPYIVFVDIASPTNNTLAGASDLQNSLWQIDVFSDRVSDLDACAKTVVAAMAAAPFTNLQRNSRGGYESAVRLYRRSLDYSIWSTDN